MIGKRLKQVRKRLGLKQHQLAEMFKLTPGAISSYEIGRISPNWDTLVLICKELNINLNWLATGEGAMFLTVEDRVAPETQDNIKLIEENQKLKDEIKVKDDHIQILKKEVNSLKDEVISNHKEILEIYKKGVKS